MYPYNTPPGVGDYFFQYVYDVQNNLVPLADGQDYRQLGIPINNGQFLMRYWSGLSTLATGLTIYDWLNRQFSSNPMRLGGRDPWAQGIVLPEVVYPENNGNIRFDLLDVAQTVIGTDGDLTIYGSQLVFSGVRRRADVQNDPVPSTYKYYEKKFDIPYTLSVDRYASTGGVFNAPQQIQLLVEDYDFELRRIELVDGSDGSSSFKIMLYDANKQQRSNIPVLAKMLCHLGAAPSSTSGGQLNFWPCPPMLYPIGSTVKFDIYSLLVSPTELPANFNLLFSGIRRIPC